MTVLGLSDATARADESGPLSVEGARPRPVGARPDELPKATPAPVDKWFANAAIVRGGEGGHSEQKWRFAEEVAQKLVIDERSRPAAIEQYRRVAAGLHHSQKQFGTKVVMLASAVNAEGKSLSACNLALTLSQSYRKRVVLIDCDLRHPGLTELFKLPVTSGLSDALRAKSKRPLPLFQVAPGLVVVPAGRPDPDPPRWRRLESAPPRAGSGRAC